MHAVHHVATNDDVDTSRHEARDVLAARTMMFAARGARMRSQVVRRAAIGRRPAAAAVRPDPINRFMIVKLN